MESQIIPYEPHFLYPVIKAQDDREAIIGVYILHKVIDIETRLNHVKLLNASKEAILFLNFDYSCDAVVIIRNVLGEVMKEEKVHFEKGLTSVEVPRSGLVELNLIEEK